MSEKGVHIDDKQMNELLGRSLTHMHTTMLGLGNIWILYGHPNTRLYIIFDFKL